MKGMFGGKKSDKDENIDSVGKIKEVTKEEYEINYNSTPKNNREKELQKRKEAERVEELKKKGVIPTEEELKEKKKKEEEEFGEIPDSEDSKMGEEVEKTLLNSVLGPHIQGDDVTDISFNGWELYIQDSKGLHKVPDSGITGKDIENLGRQVANISNKTFTNSDPILDTAIGRYRLNFMHSSVSPFGATTAIRVSKPSLAIRDVSKLANGSVIQFLNLCMKVGENLIISGQTGSGKSIDVNEQIDTPEGLKTMGDLKVGDYVYDRIGQPTKVLGVYPQGKLDVYEFKLTDGRTVRASEDHIWTTITDKGKFRNYTTKEMIDKGLSMPGRNENCKYFYLPMNGAVEKSEKEFKVHPYVIGALLGDGCLTDRSLELSSEDDWIPNKVGKLIGAGEVRPRKTGYGWNFYLPEGYDNEANGISKACIRYQTKQFFDDKMLDVCRTRYIPEEYFEGSIEQRYELLQGLMDTDGSITGSKSKRYTVSFSTTSEQLGKDVLRLGRSLGFKMTLRDVVRKREGRKDTRDITVNFLVPNEVKHKLFSLPRKVERGLECKDIKKKARYDRIGISDIRKLDYQEEMVCILVDNEEHLFQVGQGIVTHNTEFQKFLVGYIPDNKKITLMEDTPDSHLKTIYRNKDINSWVTKRGGDGGEGKVDFTDLLKSALRNNPDWVTFLLR